MLRSSIFKNFFFFFIYEVVYIYTRTCRSVTIGLVFVCLCRLGKDDLQLFRVGYVLCIFLKFIYKVVLYMFI